MADQSTIKLKRHYAQRRTRLEALLGRAKTIELIAFFGVVGAIVTYWLIKDKQDAAQIAVGLLLALLALFVELARVVAALRRSVEEVSCGLCWEEEETVSVLRKFDELARSNSHVYAVWGALAFSSDFSSFVRRQLKDLTEHNYEVDRWVDIENVDFPTLVRHLKQALRAMKGGKYILHLVPRAPFGAMVVDDKAAAINFQADPNRDGVLGIYGEDATLAHRITTMIKQLGDGLVLPGPDPRSASLESLKRQAEEYYVQNGRPLTAYDDGGQRWWRRLSLMRR
jgi:hypothetical protein